MALKPRPHIHPYANPEHCPICQRAKAVREAKQTPNPPTVTYAAFSGDAWTDDTPPEPRCLSGPPCSECTCIRSCCACDAESVDITTAGDLPDSVYYLVHEPDCDGGCGAHGSCGNRW